MHLVIIHKTLPAEDKNNLLRFALENRPAAKLTIKALVQNWPGGSNNDTVVAVPEDWQVKPLNHHYKVRRYVRGIALQPDDYKKTAANRWFIISNARFITQINHKCIERILENSDADVITVSAEPSILPYHEIFRLTSNNNIAGFRRFFPGCILPDKFPRYWPHHLLIRTCKLNKILTDGMLPADFCSFMTLVCQSRLRWGGIKIAGSLLDLTTETGLLKFFLANMVHNNRRKFQFKAKIVGKILLGENVRIADSAVIIGPAVICDNAEIAPAVVIKNSIIGPGRSITYGSFVQNRVMLEPEPKIANPVSHHHSNTQKIDISKSYLFYDRAHLGDFRAWPRFSYSRFGKRLIDIITSLLILLLFAPFFPLIAMAIKLSSCGPVFFRHRRQGLYGREFLCLKFRTMVVGADELQDKLRFKNLADGPQFSIKNDPRVTLIGKFLRETFIDEIPQFINILLGQMSLVGPRPSPASENALCPFWRDARLSVRPGITGLWQICRTRQPGRDFQEWIYYDTKYVRELSPSLDFVICLKTAKKLIANFIEQF